MQQRDRLNPTGDDPREKERERVTCQHASFLLAVRKNNSIKKDHLSYTYPVSRKKPEHLSKLTSSKITIGGRYGFLIGRYEVWGTGCELPRRYSTRIISCVPFSAGIPIREQDEGPDSRSPAHRVAGPLRLPISHWIEASPCKPGGAVYIKEKEGGGAGGAGGSLLHAQNANPMSKTDISLFHTIFKPLTLGARLRALIPPLLVDFASRVFIPRAM